LGFLAHHLAFGSNFSNRLDIIKNEIMGEKGDNEVHGQIVVLTYVSELRRRIEIAQHLAEQNTNSSHARI